MWSNASPLTSLASHIKFTLLRHCFFGILTGHTSWGNLQERGCCVVPKVVSEVHHLLPPPPALFPTTLASTADLCGFSWGRGRPDHPLRGPEPLLSRSCGTCRLTVKIECGSAKRCPGDKLNAKHISPALVIKQQPHFLLMSTANDLYQ